MKREYTRIALLFPPCGVIHNELCRHAGERGAQAVNFRVPAANTPVDPESFVDNPGASFRALRGRRELVSETLDGLRPTPLR